MRPTCWKATIWPADLPVALQDGTQDAEGATLHFGPFQLATLRITR